MDNFIHSCHAGIERILFIFAWNKYQHEAAAEAIMLAESLESVIYPDDVAKLSGDAGDLQKSEYIMIKNSLTRLAAVKNPINFAYHGRT